MGSKYDESFIVISILIDDEKHLVVENSVDQFYIEAVEGLNNKLLLRLNFK